MTKKKVESVPLSYLDVYRLQGRVGRTPVERLTWALDFAQRELYFQTPGEWLSLSEELWAFIVTHVWWEGPTTFQVSDIDLYMLGKIKGSVFAPRIPPDRILKTQNRMLAFLGRLAQGKSVTYGPIKKTFRINPPKRGGPKSRLWKTYHALFGTPRDIEKRSDVFERFFDLMNEMRGDPDRCADEKCRHWFVSNRFEQKYCSTQCQNRAKSRRTMAAKRKAAKKKKKKRSAKRKR